MIFNFCEVERVSRPEAFKNVNLKLLNISVQRILKNLRRTV